ncbi:MAG: hypothetical protein ABL879_15360 [Devosia sp.]
MNGKKTYFAGAGTMLLGLAQIILAFSNPEAGTDFNQGVQTFLGGLAIIGVGHKLEKASS